MGCVRENGLTDWEENRETIRREWDCVARMDRGNMRGTI